MSDVTLATEQGAIDLSIPCDVDLSSYQYYFVKKDTSELLVACGANEKPLGILQNKPNGATKRDVGLVRIQGVSKLKLAEAVVFGNFLTSTSAAKGEVCDAAGEEYGAKALSSGDAGDLIQVLVVHGEVEATDA